MAGGVIAAFERRGWMIRREQEEDEGPGGGRFRAFGEFVTSWRPAERWETPRFSDPGPFLRESVERVKSL
jgi:hypothetical protein